MPTRRTLLATLTAIAAAGRIGRVRAQAADVAAAFIDKLLRDLTAVVNGAGSQQDRRAALAQIVESTVDVAGVARFCLGRFWRSATPAQQHDYLELFHRVLINAVTGHVGNYRGVTYTVARSTARDDEFVVPTILTRPNNAPNKIEWLVSTASGSLKIIDVVTEGVSLRLTQRSDYASYLQRNNSSVQALIDAMRQQVSNPEG